MLLLGLLGGGLVCLLVVNTTLAANSIEIIRLQQTNSAGTARIQQLEQKVGAEQSAAAIEAKARRLGMRTVGMPTYVDLRARSLSGDATNGQPAKIPAR
jgi:cell division protein FtsB